MAIKIKKISIKNESDYLDILKRAKSDISEAFDVVIPILKDVEQNGDAAIRRYTEKFDKIALDNFKFETNKIEANIPEDWKKALEKAKSNIRQFHSAQLKTKTEINVSGNRLGIKYTPVESVAVYAPGG